MSQGLLNLLFSTVTKLEKAKSRYLANYFLSSKGLKSSLLRTISRNEEIRYGIFHDKFKEQRALANSEGLENLDRLYSNSLINSGEYHTQRFRLELLKNSQIAERYNRNVTDHDNLNWYKLKHAGSLGSGIEKSVFNYYNRVSQNRHSNFWNENRKENKAYTIV